VTAATIPAFGWKNNATLIADGVAPLYLPADAVVLDPTYGKGGFWKKYRPPKLIAHDLKLDGVDFTALPEADDSVDVVAFDPPYKLNGTPTDEIDECYGVDEKATIAERHWLIEAGIVECTRVLRPGGLLLLKCQDQVSSGRANWQADDVTAWCRRGDLEKIDRFGVLRPRPQPMEGRTQRHAHGQPSFLLVFRKPRRRR
jgi:hypothetical protein